MGKGKGSFDHWATRMAVNQVLFEIRGRIHEQIVKDAFRLAGNKLPGEVHGRYFDILSILTIIRPMGVCEEGRPCRRWNYEAGWCDIGRFEETEETGCSP